MRRRETAVFSVAFLDLLSGALGAVIILYISVPKSKVVDNSKNPIKPPEAVFKEVKKDTPHKQNDFDAYLNELEEIKKKIAEVSGQNKELKEKNQFLMQENERLITKVLGRGTSSNAEKSSTDKTGVPVDVGFKFKGKEIVFIIDVSGSMFMEDRIGQVKAGLKMLITSMGEDYKINVIQFPDGVQGKYKRLWSHLKSMTPENKREVYQFLLRLKPYGSTPTREVLYHSLRAYPDASDFVLLSDGAPTLPNSRHLDDIGDILAMAVRNNQSKIQINTIGVGSDFLTDRTNPKYLFLENLAKDHNGFFYGF